MDRLNEIINNALNEINDTKESSYNSLGKMQLENGKILIPMNKISMAIISGNGAMNNSSNNKFGAEVIGVTIKPVGCFVVDEQNMKDAKIINLNEDNKWVEFVQAAINLIKKK